MSQASLSEEERRFLKALTERDPRAFKLLVLRFQDRVFSLARRLLNDPEDARDLTQEVFVSIFEHIESYRAESTLKTWVMQIAVNRAKNRLRYLSKRTELESSHVFEEGREGAEPLVGQPHFLRPDQALNREELARQLEAALSQLEPEQRVVVVLRDIEGLAYEEIVEIVEAPLGTVKSRIARGRAHMKELLAKLNPAFSPRKESR